MDPTSTTPGDNPDNSDATAESTTTTDPTNTGTDNQPANTGDNLEDTSKSTDAADGDKNPTDDTKTDDAPASKFDDDLDEWIEKRGLAKPENDEQKQSYQDLRNGQREYTKSQQAKQKDNDVKSLSDKVNELNPTDDNEEDDLDPLEKDVQEMKAQLREERVTRLQTEYFVENNVTTEESEAMGAVLKELVAKEDTPQEKKAALDYWTNPKRLSQWHQLAKARIGEASDTDAIVDEATRKERERIAKESNANSPGRGAKTTTQGTKTPEQERLERFSNWD